MIVLKTPTMVKSVELNKVYALEKPKYFEYDLLSEKLENRMRFSESSYYSKYPMVHYNVELI